VHANLNILSALRLSLAAAGWQVRGPAISSFSNTWHVTAHSGKKDL
jgi:hypothetical protein